MKRYVSLAELNTCTLHRYQWHE